MQCGKSIFSGNVDLLMLSQCSVVHTSEIRKTHWPAAGSFVPARILSAYICFEPSMSFILLTDGWLDLHGMTSGLDHLTQRDKKCLSSKMAYKMSQLSQSLLDNQYIDRTIKMKSPLLLVFFLAAV